MLPMLMTLSLDGGVQLLYNGTNSKLFSNVSRQLFPPQLPLLPLIRSSFHSQQSYRRTAPDLHHQSRRVRWLRRERIKLRQRGGEQHYRPYSRWLCELHERHNHRQWYRRRFKYRGHCWWGGWRRRWFGFDRASTVVLRVPKEETNEERPDFRTRGPRRRSARSHATRWK